MWLVERCIGAVRNLRKGYTIPDSSACGETRIITLRNGFRCAYTSTGSGPPIILLHGWGQSRRTWARTMPLLSSRYSVYALDLPGFGESETPRAILTLYDYADCVSAFAEQLAITPYAIVGHSFGGRVASLYAATHSLDALVLCGVADPTRRSAAQWLHAWCIAHLGRLAPVCTYDIDRTWFTPIGYADTAPMTVQRARTMLAIYRATHTMQDVPLERITARTLCVYGTRDRITPPSHAPRVWSRISRSERFLIRGGGHFVHITKHALFAKRVLDFLGSEIREPRTQPVHDVAE